MGRDVSLVAAEGMDRPRGPPVNFCTIPLVIPHLRVLGLLAYPLHNTIHSPESNPVIATLRAYIMRYEDWDVLIFPMGRDAKVPMKEFKVACHAIPDGEFSHSHGAFGMPVMTCFVPSLGAGTAFHISIHSWRSPEISQFTRTYSKHSELVKFECRILIDGRIVAYGEPPAWRS